ncbi:MAG: alpha/beta hydrolase [Hyphomicrobiaceae bacterium]|nr:alpha/beta hydrolase [Hyphomicrobiaceae bacterium]
MIPAPSGRIAVTRWPGSRPGPTALLIHATGFHSRLWDAVVADLPDELTVIAPDLRGHGRSENKSPEPRWSAFGDDIIALIDHFSLEAAIGVGHSMGGWCAVYSALARPQAFANLLLIDPVLSEPHIYRTEAYAGLAGAHEHPVARRRSKWPSWQDFAARLAERPPFSLWQRRILDDYCRYGLLPASDGDGFELACPPLVEATVYFNRRYADLNPRLGAVTCPVTVLRAAYAPFDPTAPVDFSRSTTWPGLAEAFPHGRDIERTDLTHFIPMQAPTDVARHIAEHAAAPRG